MDGVSTVTRTIGTGTSARAQSRTISENTEVAPTRKRGASSRAGRKKGKENATRVR